MKTLAIVVSLLVLEFALLSPLASLAKSSSCNQDFGVQKIAAYTAAPSLETFQNTLSQPAPGEGKAEEKVQKVEGKVEEIVQEVARYYSGLQSLSMKMTTSLIIEAEGLKNEMTSNYDIAFKQPNKLSMVLKSGFLGGTAVCDGSQLTFYSPLMNRYVTTKAPSHISNVFGEADFPVIGGGFTKASLFESLLDKKPYESIMSGVERAEYLGIEKIDDTDCHHLKFEHKDFIGELWVDAGKQPWVRKVVADISKSISNTSRKIQNLPINIQKAKMQVIATYKEFVPGVALSEQQFSFVLPEQAKLVKSFLEVGTSSNATSGPSHPLTKKSAPDFTLNTLSGKQLHLNEHKTKNIVVLDFWATWCGPCVRALPILAEVTAAYKDKNVVFYAVNEQEGPKAIREFLKEKGLEVQVALDQEGKIGELYEAKGIPQTVIIDKEGIIQYVHVGFHPNLKEKLSAELDALLAKDTDDAKKTTPIR